MDEVIKQGIDRLPADALDAVAAYGAKATWPANFIIYQRGTDADGLFIVLRGRVALRSKVKSGRGFAPGIATAGETFGTEGLAQNSRYVTDARADEETETLYLSGVRFRAFLREQPQHAIALIGQVMAERGMLLERLRELATLSVEQRLLNALLRLADASGFEGDDGRLMIGPAQYRLLCELIGATRESVSVVMGRLVSEGVAERQGASILVAPDALRSRTSAETDVGVPVSRETEGARLEA